MSKKIAKIIVILGPTASGKTALGVKLAHKFNGEIVSADSRQVYRGMDIGTGKDLAEYEFSALGEKIKIPYHLIDIVSPKKVFNLAEYQKLAYASIDDILSRGKTPFLVGGSGLYLQAVVDGYNLKGSMPDKKIREKLEKATKEKLFEKLKKLNFNLANSLNNSDKNNKRRLIRYIERCNCEVSKEVKSRKRYNPLVLGIKISREEIKDKIYKRLIVRLENENMLGEVKKLHQNGVSWKKMESFGLEYKFLAFYLQNKLNYKDMVENLSIATYQFAKRQMNWFSRWEKKGIKINWLKDKKEAEELVKIFFKI